MDRRRDLARDYNLLGLTPEALKDDARRAYRKLVKKTHPDITKQDGKKFIDVKEAYKNVLSAIKEGIRPKAYKPEFSEEQYEKVLDSLGQDAREYILSQGNVESILRADMLYRQAESTLDPPLRRNLFLEAAKIYERLWRFFWPYSQPEKGRIDCSKEFQKFSHLEDISKHKAYESSKKPRHTFKSLECHFAPITATVSILSITAGIFFLSTNITGNVIGLNQSTGNIVGAILLIVGLVGGFFWLKGRKKK